MSTERSGDQENALKRFVRKAKAAIGYDRQQREWVTRVEPGYRRRRRMRRKY